MNNKIIDLDGLTTYTNNLNKWIDNKIESATPPPQILPLTSLADKMIEYKHVESTNLYKCCIDTSFLKDEGNLPHLYHLGDLQSGFKLLFQIKSKDATAWNLIHTIQNLKNGTIISAENHTQKLIIDIIGFEVIEVAYDENGIILDDGVKINKNVYSDQVLSKTNINEFTPTSDYHPATKKYVDDNITSLPDPVIHTIEDISTHIDGCTVEVDDSNADYTKLKIKFASLPVVPNGVFTGVYRIPNSYQKRQIRGYIYVNDKLIAGGMRFIDYSTTNVASLNPIVVIGIMNQETQTTISLKYNEKVSTFVFDVNTGEQVSNYKSLYADASAVLFKNNMEEYTPTSDYHPSTKKYVDDSIAAIPKPTYSDLGNVPIYDVAQLPALTDGKITIEEGTELVSLPGIKRYTVNISADLKPLIISFTGFITKINLNKPDGTNIQSFFPSMQPSLVELQAGYKRNGSALADPLVVSPLVLTVIDRTITFNSFTFNSDYSVTSSIQSSLPRTSEVLTKTNTAEYTPKNDYNPATKKYVDDSITNNTPLVATTDEINNLFGEPK